MSPELFFTNDKRRLFGTLWLVAWLALGAVFLWNGLDPNESQPTPLDTSSASMSEESSRSTKPIERIQVGERVATGISNELRELADEEIGALPDWDSKSIDPDSWRKVELTLTREDGSAMDIALLRPAAWITENRIAAGHELFLAIPEMRQQGMAYIEAVGKCPAIKQGNGRVVTGTFASTVDEVVEVHIDGLAEPIRSTPEHPFYRVNDKQFVPASGLRNGDQVQHLGGLAQVERTLPKTGTFRVHNLEVHGDHVFRISTAGVLVHNTWTVSAGGNSAHITKVGEVAHIEIGYIQNANKAFSTAVRSKLRDIGAKKAIINTGPVQNMDKAIDLGLRAQRGKRYLGGDVRLVSQPGATAPIFEIVIELVR